MAGKYRLSNEQGSPERTKRPTYIADESIPNEKI
jgi:hypothetical protein